MRASLRRVLLLSLFAVCLLGLTGSPASARAASLAHSFDSARATDGKAEGKSEGRELFYKCINLAILVGALAYVLRKPMADFFAQRSASIRKGLEDGRRALEASQAQLKAVEGKLQQLEEEIAAFKASAAREMESERQRLKAAAAEEAEKILQSARAQTEAAVRAAKLELKSFAAGQAVKLAEEIIRRRLDGAAQEKLVGDFLAGVGSRGVEKSRSRELKVDRS